MNIVEIIIKAVTEQAKKGFDDTATSAQKMGAMVKRTADDVTKLGKAALIAVGILYGLGRVLQSVADRAADLGRQDVAAAFNRAKNSVDLLIDTLLTIPLVNGNILDAVKNLADGFSLAMKEITVLTIIALDGIKGMGITVLRLIGMVEEAVGISTKWTQEWYNVTRATIAANDQLAIANVWTQDLNKNVTQLGHSMGDLSRLQKANVTTLEDTIKANQRLNDQYERRKSLEDAIRAGDPRAYYNALNGGGGASGSVPFRGTPRGGGGTGNGVPGSGEKEFKPTVNVYIGNSQLNKHINSQINKTVFKSGRSNTGSDAAKFPGKDQ